MTLLQYVLLFFIYSFIGWLYESIICSKVKYHKFINRGFLTGPYCPIYGAGAVLNWVLLADTEGAVVIFIASAMVSCVIEYMASYVMELVFHARWWDYSQIPFNLNGRVCLFGGILFGLGNLLLVKSVLPWTIQILDRIPRVAEAVGASILIIIFSTDLILTVINTSQFMVKIRELSEKAVEFARTKTFSKREKRLLKAFPNFRSLNYQSIVEKIKEYLL